MKYMHRTRKQSYVYEKWKKISTATDTINFKMYNNNKIKIQLN